MFTLRWLTLLIFISVFPCASHAHQDEKRTICSSFFVLCSLFTLVVTACSGPRTVEPHSQLSAVRAASGSSTAGFTRALQPQPFDFPRDHGAHPDYATEWWYFTGNLDTD